ncbi:hypothetical protein LINPERHAP1_LOCUS3793 [Linum perenne]
MSRFSISIHLPSLSRESNMKAPSFDMSKPTTPPMISTFPKEDKLQICNLYAQSFSPTIYTYFLG